ncbi:MAG TPA: ferritin-like domain-containing protein [Solirubrobacteraceae bacterium]
MPAQTRRELLRGGAAGAGGAAAGVLLAAASAQAAPAPAAVSVTDRLQRLIRIELLLAFSYRHVLASSVLTPRARRTLTPFVAHEQAHIAALERELTARGATLPAAPASVAAANHDLGHRKVGGRLGQLRGDLDAVRLLLTLEQVTIGAYFVALLKLEETGLIELASQIMANEAQHDAMLGLLMPPNKPADAVPYGLVQGLQ